MSKKPTKINVVDVEACCWEPVPPMNAWNEIIEIGITQIGIDSKQIIKSDSFLVIPEQNEISEFCTKLTTITNTLIDQSGDLLTYAINKLKSDYDIENQIFASWGNYDVKSMEENCRRKKVKYYPSNMTLNVKALFAAKYGKRCGMAEACEHLGIEPEGTHHRGIDDSKNIAKILLKLL